MWCRIVAICILIACVSPAPPPENPRIPRTTPTQEYTTAMIEHTCIESHNLSDLRMSQRVGTGVVIDDYHVLTAFHVIECPVLSYITVKLADNRVFRMVVTKSEPTRDLAMLSVFGSKGFELQLGPALIGQPPKQGSDVCFFTGAPQRTRRCGPYNSRIKTDKLPDAMFVIAQADPGNSGSGIYDVSGRLVGIVTHNKKCPNDPLKNCYTFASVLSGFAR